MRIKSINLAWFRGAVAPVALVAESKSLVVYGENGSEKSSFVDAVSARGDSHSRLLSQGNPCGNVVEYGSPKGGRPSTLWSPRQTKVACRRMKNLLL